MMEERNTLCIIGAGQLGSRHLQALANVTLPLSIHVIDPSEASLQVAKERYEAVAKPENPHAIRFATSVDGLPAKLDLAIIPTSANVRRFVVEKLLKVSSVRYMILEKLLFPKMEDYDAVSTLLKERNTVTWVNCSMRTMPFYVDLRERFQTGGPMQYRTTGSQYGLITNAIHYMDYLAYLTGRDDATVYTDGLEPKPFESKRKGFLELNGTLRVRFGDGSEGTFTCYENGTAPILMEIFNTEHRVISRESEQRAWMSAAADEWRWQEVDAPIPFQSAMTTKVVTDLLTDGTCPLTPYDFSAKLHLLLLEPLRKHLNTKSVQTFDHYPFT